MGKLASVPRVALGAGVVVLAGELLVHEGAVFPVATLHSQVIFTHLHLPMLLLVRVVKLTSAALWISRQHFVYYVDREMLICSNIFIKWKR